MIVRALACFPNWLLRVLGWMLNVAAAISLMILGIFATFFFEPATTHNHTENAAMAVHLVFPQAGIVLLLAVIARVFVGKAKLRQSRLKQNLCAGCGYDLRATPNQCPECGAKNSNSASRAC